MGVLKTSPKCQTMECLHSNWMTYGRSLPKEFRKHFEEACKELNIPLYVLPPYSPKQNGRIERSNRTMREGVVFPANEVSGWKQAFIVIEILQNIVQN